jgi:hypothetical protein
MYNQFSGARHLDVGVASGYFLDHTKWPVAKPKITLMDLNPKATRYAADRLRRRRYDISEVVGNALEPFPVVESEKEKFDSIGLFHLLHCIPGSLLEKKDVLRHAGNVLEPENGVVFGANVTPVDVPKTSQNFFATSVLRFSHSMGALNNQQDSHADMEAILDEMFEEYELRRVGYMSLWHARKPKSIQ